MLYNLHTHSHYCGHGSGEIAEYADYASAEGFEVLGFSEHCPFPTELFHRTRMPFAMMGTYEKDVRARASEHSFPVLLGYEIDYSEEFDSYFRTVLDHVDYLIAGVHFVACPDGTYHTPFNPGFSDDDVRRYADAAVKVMETGLISFLAHPDVFLCRRRFDKVAEEAAITIASAAAELSIPLEINGNGLLKGNDEAEGYPSPCFWHIARDYVSTAVISSDAHVVKNLDRTLPFCRSFASDSGFDVLDPYVKDGRLAFRKEQES